MTKSISPCRLVPSCKCLNHSSGCCFQHVGFVFVNTTIGSFPNTSISTMQDPQWMICKVSYPGKVYYFGLKIAIFSYCNYPLAWDFHSKQPWLLFELHSPNSLYPCFQPRTYKWFPVLFLLGVEVIISTTVFHDALFRRSFKLLPQPWTWKYGVERHSAILLAWSKMIDDARIQAHRYRKCAMANRLVYK